MIYHTDGLKDGRYFSFEITLKQDNHRRRVENGFTKRCIIYYVLRKCCKCMSKFIEQTSLISLVFVHAFCTFQRATFSLACLHNSFSIITFTLCSWVAQQINCHPQKRL